MSDAVTIRGFTRRFGGGMPVLDRLDLSIGAGEFVALLGRSGSGKSTLLRALAGLDPVSEGSVTMPAGRAVVFQDPRLLPWKRVWQNVALGLREGGPRAAAESAVREVELGHRIDAWPATLSGGEAQRAALARALIRSPDLLLLDEPFAALDALTRLRMQRMVGELWARRGCAVLLVTHDVDEALLLADRAVVLQHGRIVTDITVPMARPRRHSDPLFAEMRSGLLGALGVDEREAA